MSDSNQDNEKETVHIADLVKCAVLVWSATLLTVSYLGFFPQMKMDNTFVASLLTGAMASFGIERKNNNGNGNGNGNDQKKATPKIEQTGPSK
tara:strand:- start:74 stop:352 length:279 start_codon:yes stop_codon:yes gene_type:complete